MPTMHPIRYLGARTEDLVAPILQVVASSAVAVPPTPHLDRRHSGLGTRLEATRILPVRVVASSEGLSHLGSEATAKAVRSLAVVLVEELDLEAQAALDLEVQLAQPLEEMFRLRTELRTLHSLLLLKRMLVLML